MICAEIAWRSPYAAFAPLAGEPHAHLLSAGDRAGGGWSVLVAFPAEIIEAQANEGAAWLAAVQGAIDERAIGASDGLPDAPFHTGLVGFVGYEALNHLEPSLAPPSSPYDLPEAAFGVYDATALFSRKEQRAYIVARSRAALRRLESTLGTEQIGPSVLPAFSAVASNFSRSAYEAAVLSVIEKIKNGDFYQANIAQTLIAKSDDEFSPFELFRTISGESEADFGALLQYPDGAVISNSPERFFQLRLDGDRTRRIITEPIKGARGRSSDPTKDAALAEALINDPKDRAENIMIADLMRNDLSKICEDGSIKEEAICALMTLSKVRHLVSRISGVLRESVSTTDIFRALFPSGSITGAPKIEAMRAIGEIEKIGRGPYCGGIGYIDDRGGADFSVAIRTLIMDANAKGVSVPVGGGVTLRSVPQAEYEETLIKARGALDALSLQGDARS